MKAQLFKIPREPLLMLLVREAIDAEAIDARRTSNAGSTWNKTAGKGLLTEFFFVLGPKQVSCLDFQFIHLWSPHFKFQEWVSTKHHRNTACLASLFRTVNAAIKPWSPHPRSQVTHDQAQLTRLVMCLSQQVWFLDPYCWMPRLQACTALLPRSISSHTHQESPTARVCPAGSTIYSTVVRPASLSVLNSWNKIMNLQTLRNGKEPKKHRLWSGQLRHSSFVDGLSRCSESNRSSDTALGGGVLPAVMMANSWLAWNAAEIS